MKLAIPTFTLAALTTALGCGGSPAMQPTSEVADVESPATSGPNHAPPPGAQGKHAGPPGRGGPGGPDGRRGPPAEAVEACKGLAESAACSFQLRDRTVDGTCVAGPKDAPLACRPNGPPPRAGDKR